MTFKGTIKVKVQILTLCTYPPAEPEALWLVVPQKGLDRIVPSRQRLITRAVGAMDVTSAPRRRLYEKNVKTQTGTDSLKCQTATATPAKPGDLLTLWLRVAMLQTFTARAGRAGWPARKRCKKDCGRIIIGQNKKLGLLLPCSHGQD